MNANRRSFIRNAALLAAGNALGIRPFGMLNAAAATSSSYKALVCVFLLGGNDANNTLVPYDATRYKNYASLRANLAVAQSALLPLTPAPTYALHPSLPEMQKLFNSGKMAFVANVGNLVQPTTRAQFLAKSVARPESMFSHADQQAQWQNGARVTSLNTGWAGRIADAYQRTYNPGAEVPMIASVSGDVVFCNGASTTPVAVIPGNAGVPSCLEGANVLAAAQQLIGLNSGVSLIEAENAIAADAYGYSKVVGEALASSSAMSTSFPSSSFGAQMRQIANLIQVQSALGVKRQIFFAGFTGFDTHANQLAVHSTLLASASAALKAFYDATVEMGLQNQVTTFTMSDFGRTLQPNSAGGTDHAWGGHQMVIGGAVKGGKIYGTFPTLELGGADDCDANGRWIPTTSSTQYSATLAQWFGLPSSQVSSIFPLAKNFTSNNLGFLG